MDRRKNEAKIRTNILFIIDTKKTAKPLYVSTSWSVMDYRERFHMKI